MVTPRPESRRAPIRSPRRRSSTAAPSTDDADDRLPPHPEAPALRPAQLTARVLDLKVAPVKVGYVMGGGDRVPEAIRRLGLSVTMLTDDDLRQGISRASTPS
jgi:hypothetical protein